ncbi:DsrE family protein [Pantoea sp. BAV 3049]|uniref:DsrE family protein n=1 Tax=Pantoea sp. BAV 3049 TaxID=2654188 RepID=UPI00131CD9CB|nr:DsrE family protein [Pantoea sp. BAV 3049]
MRQTLQTAVIAAVVSILTVKASAIYQKTTDLVSSNSTPPKGFWQTPTIEGYGKIHDRPMAAFRPDSSQHYKVVFQIQNGHQPKQSVNSELDHVARTVNLYVAAGVPLQNLKFVVAIAGSATPVVLDNQHYHEKFGVDNPNLPLIARLKQAGIIVSVCDQAVAGHNYPFDWVDNNVTHALSNLTTVTTLQQQGYVLMPM